MLLESIGGLIGNRLSRHSSARALQDDRNWASEQAQKQMDFQREMSNTSWQRGVADMQAAGLNPALAYMQGGASSAGGAMAQTSSTDMRAMLQRERMAYGLANTAIRESGSNQRAMLNSATRILA